jgi:hypothetical protein
MFKRIVLSALMLSQVIASPTAFAVYNNNISGVVRFVAVYADGDYIYFHLENQPTTHPVCNPIYFVISETVPENRRNQMFATLLAAKISGEPIHIGYDDSTECTHGFIRVHRVG